jgi:uncharacterized repeat protein (TIGR01451 family)
MLLHNVGKYDSKIRSLWTDPSSMSYLRHFILYFLTASFVSFNATGQEWIIKNFPSDYVLSSRYDLEKIGSNVYFIFAGESKSQIAKFDGTTWNFITDCPLTSIHDLSQDNDGNLLVYGDGIARLKGDHWYVYPIKDQVNVDGKLTNINGDILMWYNDSKLMQVSMDAVPYDTSYYTMTPPLNRERFWEIAATDNFSDIYVSGRETLLRSGPFDNTFFIDTAFLQYIGDVYVDHENALWLTGDGKIYKRKINETLFTEIVSPFNVSFSAIKGDKNGRMYFGSSGAGLIIKDGDTWTKLDKSAGVFDEYIHDIELDDDGNIWLLTEFGLVLVIHESEGVNTVRGKVFHDINTDGEQNENEPGIAGQIISINAEEAYTITNTNGEFTVKPGDGNNTVKWIANGFWQQGATEIEHSFDFPFASPPDLNIGVTQKIAHDLAVTVTATATRPGFNTQYYVTVSNEGSVVSAGSSTVSLEFDPLLTFIESDVTPASISGNKIVWNVNALESLEQKKIFVRLNLPPSTPLGTRLQNVVTVSSLAGETDLHDNTDSLQQIVTGSYDPNDKLVKEGVMEDNLVVLNSKLTYTIRFQNTGTDTAFYVKISDVLDAALDISTLEVLSASHPIIYSLDGRKLIFEFNDILLPDSNRNEPASHGYVKFRIGHKSGLMHGTTVTNQANIYFDFNTPVTTNVVSNMFVSEQYLKEVTTENEESIGQQLSVYPNPARGSFKLEIPQGQNFQFVEVRSLIGSLVAVRQVTSVEMSFNDFLPGVYVIQLFGSRKIACKKIVIER